MDGPTMESILAAESSHPIETFFIIGRRGLGPITPATRRGTRGREGGPLGGIPLR
jgi:hypothetical protein